MGYINQIAACAAMTVEDCSLLGNDVGGLMIVGLYAP
jgi:hypothetical protein